MVKLTRRDKIIIGLFYLIGWASFFATSYIFGKIVDFQLNYLLISILYFISSGFCWISIMLLLRPKRIVKVKEPIIKERTKIVEKPIVVEKIVEKEAPVSKPRLEEREKNYFVGSNNTMKFHAYNCKWADNIKRENRLYFKEKSDAIRNGFKKCKTCLS